MSVKKRALTNEEMNSAAGGRVEKHIIGETPGPYGAGIVGYWVLDDEKNKPVACYRTSEAARNADKAYCESGTVLQEGQFGFGCKYNEKSFLSLDE